MYAFVMKHMHFRDSWVAKACRWSIGGLWNLWTIQKCWLWFYAIGITDITSCLSDKAQMVFILLAYNRLCFLVVKNVCNF